jgi:uncharacterized membrane protein YoaK (UPF0700 family)
VDAASLLALGHVFTANMTGNVVFMAFALSGAPGLSMNRSAIALLSALVGGVLAGHMDKRLVWKRRNIWLSTSFAIEAIFLTFAFCLVWFSRGESIQASTVDSLIVLTGVGMGIRNGTVRRLAVPDLTTTVLTLTVAGLAFDSFIAGGDNIRWQRKVGSIVMMFMGAARGVMLLRHSLALVLGGAALWRHSVRSSKFFGTKRSMRPSSMLGESLTEMDADPRLRVSVSQRMPKWSVMAILAITMLLPIQLQR